MKSLKILTWIYFYWSIFILLWSVFSFAYNYTLTGFAFLIFGSYFMFDSHKKIQKLRKT